MNKKTITFVIFLLLSIILLSLIWNSNIWYDEGYSISLINHSYIDIIKITAKDVHPPAYYIMLKLFTTFFKNNIIIMKFFSIIPSILLLLFSATKLRQEYGFKKANLFSIMFVSIPILLLNSIEIRMYSWSMFLVFISFYYSLKLLKTNKTVHWIIFLLTSVFACYMHYYALISTFIIYLLLLISVLKTNKKIIINYIIVAIITILAYLPWLYVLLKQFNKVKESYWISELKLSNTYNYLKEIFNIGKNSFFSVGIFLSLIVISILLLIFNNKINKKIYLKSIIVFCLPIVIGIIISNTIKPIFIPRYIVPVLPVLIFFLSGTLSQISSYKIYAIICTGLFIIMFFSYKEIYKNQYKKNTYLEFLNNDVKDNDAIITNTIFSLLGTVYKNKNTYYINKIFDYYPFSNLKLNNDLDYEKHDNYWLIINYDENISDELSEMYNYYKTVEVKFHIFHIYKLKDS